MTIPLFATRPALEPLIPLIAERQSAVLASGQYILGPEVSAFEDEFAKFLGANHCVGVANGTEAITIALRAVGVQPGDEVIVPALTFFATAEAVVNAGAVPVFCDIDPQTYCMTAATAEPMVTQRTRALLPVHLFGNVAPVGELCQLAEAHSLKLVEDAAQAAGAKLDGKMAGALGDVGTFSFYPGKNLGGVGDGGAVVTNDLEVADRVRQLRFHGSTDKVIHTKIGYNSRLDSLQAAALRVMLPHLDEWTQHRRTAAAAYDASGLDAIATLPTPTPGCEPCHHLYVITSPRRDELQVLLVEAGIESRPYYTTPMHHQPALKSLAGDTSLPVAERVAAENLALPMGPCLSSEDIDTVAATLLTALASA